MSTPKPPPTPYLAKESVSDDQIRDYLSSNPGMSDRDIAKAMDQYGVSVSQMSRATGVDKDEVGNRYRQASASNVAGISPTPAPRVDPVVYPQDEEKRIGAIKGFNPMEVRSPEVGILKNLLGTYVPRPRGGPPRDFALMAAVDPLTNERTTLIKKGGSVKKKLKGKW